MPWYIDTSAFLKLLVVEPETEAMRSWFSEKGSHWSSHLLRTEAMRAATRLQIEASLVDSAVATVTLVLPAATTFLLAGRVAPPALRSLDALHLATLLELLPDVQGLVTYDARMAEAAMRLGVAVASPH